MSKVVDPTLPKGWRKVVSDQGVYYYCKKTRETTWDRPTAESVSRARKDAAEAAAAGEATGAAAGAATAISAETTWRTGDAEVRVVEEPAGAAAGDDAAMADAAMDEEDVDGNEQPVDVDMGMEGEGEGEGEEEDDEANVESDAESDNGDALAIVRRVLATAAARTEPASEPKRCAVCRAGVDAAGDHLCAVCTAVRPAGDTAASALPTVSRDEAPTWLAQATT